MAVSSGSIIGKVWKDDNKDTVLNGAETTLAGVTVSLWRDGDTDPIRTAVTGADGRYAFGALSAGVYYVKTDALPAAQAGYVSTTSLTPVTVGTTTKIVDLGLAPAQDTTPIDVDFGMVSGRVWKDANSNGVQDAGEQPVAGVRVDLLSASGTVVANAITGPDGGYLFDAVKPGTYVVDVSEASAALQGLKFTTINVGSNDAVDSDVDAAGKTASFVVEAGRVYDYDAGVVGVAAPSDASLSGMVFKDANNNGVREAGDNGIANVGVVLRDTAGNQVATATTDASGAYKFSNLKAGNYVVDFDEASSALTGLKLVQANQGADDSKDSDVVDVAGAKTGIVAVGQSQHVVNVDAGYYTPAPVDPATASLSGMVFKDANNNGVREAGDAGIAAVGVELRDAAGVLVKTALTDASGKYSFTGLKAGNYVVDFVEASAPLTGLKLVAADQGGNDAVDSDVTNTGWNATGVIALAMGEAKGNIDAGYAPPQIVPATVSGTVWNDANQDGIRTGNETGIKDVVVQLRDMSIPNGVNGDWKANIVAEVKTDASGNYSFTNVAPGKYQIDLVEYGADGSAKFLSTGGEANALKGLTLTAANMGGNDAVDSDITDRYNQMTDAFVVKSGDKIVNLDAGYFNPAPPAPVNTASLMGQVWLDNDRSTTWTNGDAIKGGVTVDLYKANPDGSPNVSAGIVASVVTDATGTYNFNSLAAGKYVVDFNEGQLPAGYKFFNAANSNIAVGQEAAGWSTVVDLATGQAKQWFNAGANVPAPVDTASLSGMVFKDVNNNGVREASDAGIAKVGVELRDAAGALVKTALTDDNGKYSFTGLKAGNYVVDFVERSAALDGLTLVAAKQGSDATKDSDVTNTSWNATGVIALAAGEAKGNIDAGYAPPAPVVVTQSVSGKVWNDANSNGVQDAGESGIAGVSVDLRLAGTINSVASAVTDASGNYVFKNVATGNYFVDFAEGSAAIEGRNFSKADQGTDDTKDSDVINSGGWTNNFNVAAGNNIANVDAGVVPKVVAPVDPGTASVSGYAFNDLDKSKLMDGADTQFSGMGVRLLDASGNVVATTITNINGVYKFSNLKAGNYSVDFEEAKLNASTQKFFSGGDSDIAAGKEAVGTTGVFALAMGEDKTRVDAGVMYTDPKTASLSGQVWADADRNNTWSGADSLVENVRVDLYKAKADGTADIAAGIVATTTTAAGGGNYVFRNLAAGSYVVDFNEAQLPSGYKFVTSGVSAIADGSNSGMTKAVSLDVGEDRQWFTGQAQPANLPGSVSGIVWIDQDKSGGKWTDPDWTVKTGVKVDLYEANADGSPNLTKGLIATTTTDGAGAYKFSNVQSGVKYMVDFNENQLPAGGKFVTHEGIIASDANNGWTKTFTLASGQNLEWWDGQAQLTGNGSITVGAQLWFRSVANWFSEPVNIELYSAATGALLAKESIKTYLNTPEYSLARFSNLPAGDYYVKVIYAGTLNVANVQLDQNNGSIDGGVSQTRVIHLSEGQHLRLNATIDISPIAIDLDDSGSIDTVALAAAGADDKFDLLGTGDKVRSGWLAKGDGFLVIDTNNNGKIDSVNEMFGGAIGAGFAKLAKYDTNGDGIINVNDGESFLQLKVWQDGNGDRITDPAELKTLADVGIVSLKVAYEIDPSTDGTGNIVIEKSTAVMADGREVLVGDVYFHVDTNDLSVANLAALAQHMQDSAEHVATLSVEDQTKIADVIAQASNDVINVSVNDTQDLPSGAQNLVGSGTATTQGGILADVLNIALDHLREAQPDSKALNVLEGLAKGAQNLNLADLLPGEGSGQVNLGALLDNVHGGKHADGAKGSEKANAKAHSEAWMQEAVSALGEGHAQTVLSELAKLSNTLKNHGHHD